MIPKGNPQIAIIGDICIDWSVNVDDLDHLMQKSSIEGKDCIASRLGGGGFLFSLAAKDAGFEPYLIGKVGNDFFGISAREILKRNGVSFFLPFDSNLETGKVIAIRDSSDRRLMISHRGANVNLIPKDINKKIIEECNLLYVSGYSLLESPQSKACLKAMKTAKDKGIFITLDVVPHKIFRQSLNPDYKEALSLADGVILAIGTARRILKDFNESEDTLCEKLLQSYKFIIVIFDMGENLTIASRNNIQKLSTEHSKAKNKLGYLDKYFAKHLLGFMMNK